MTGGAVRTFVVGHHVMVVALDADASPRSMHVSVRIDGVSRWSSDEPGWRDPGCGFDENHRVWVWSARRLVVIPLDPNVEPHAIECDEDIVVAVPFGDDWLLVCETSVRLTGTDGDLSRIELSDVVTGARWEEEHLLIDVGDTERAVVVVRDARPAHVGLEVLD